MKPILFSTPMVRALLNAKPGTYPVQPIDSSRPCKSQTRRVMKPQPTLESGKPDFWHWKDCVWANGGLGFPESGIADHAPHKVGDKLWVRETFCEVPYEHEHIQLADGWMSRPKIAYRADSKVDYTGMWKPSIHMPRYAARLFPEVREVRVERLQDIAEADARAEGESPTYKKLGYKECSYEREKKCHFACNCFNARENFAGLWNAISGKGAWESNPWVWVYEFMRVEK